MASPVLGDRDSKEFTAYSALDAAFANRISRCFDSLCGTVDDPHAIDLFVQRFKTATDCWNQAKDAIAAEYPQGWSQPSLGISPERMTCCSPAPRPRFIISLAIARLMQVWGAPLERTDEKLQREHRSTSPLMD